MFARNYLNKITNKLKIWNYIISDLLKARKLVFMVFFLYDSPYWNTFFLISTLTISGHRTHPIVSFQQRNEEWWISKMFINQFVFNENCSRCFTLPDRLFLRLLNQPECKCLHCIPSLDDNRRTLAGICFFSDHTEQDKHYQDNKILCHVFSSRETIRLEMTKVIPSWHLKTQTAKVRTI